MLTPLDRALTLHLAPNPEQPLWPPPVFIVGAPRTGSTLFYQLITNAFDVAYVTNLTRLFIHVPVLGEMLAGGYMRRHPHNMFRSYHGTTPGLRGPSECGPYWYRHFPRDSHFIGAGELVPAARRRLRRELAALAACSRRPFVWKNLHNGQRLQAIHEVIPEALVLWITRGTADTAASILAGRLRDHADPERWWSVRPRDVEAISRRPYPEQVVAQVVSLERQILNDLLLFAPHQTFCVRYEDLCTAPGQIVRKIEEFFQTNGLEVPRKTEAALPDIFERHERSALLSANDLAAIENAAAAFTT